MLQRPGRRPRRGVLPGCDPHRPRRVGAALIGTSTVPDVKALRSSPTPEGRCCEHDRPGGLRPEVTVAILTDPGGSVLRSPGWASPSRYSVLRSSPTPEGRCCADAARVTGATPELRSSPTPEGRCCCEVAVWDDLVSKLRSSPTPEGRCCTRRAPWVRRSGSCCDPHRPGGSVLPPPAPRGDRSLRSSPTPEGRCCCEVAAVSVSCVTLWLRSSPAPSSQGQPGCDPQGSVLRVRGAPAPAPAAGVAILTDPGGSVLRLPSVTRRTSPCGCDPHRPRKVGAAPRHRARPTEPDPRVAILTDPGGSVLRGGAPRNPGRFHEVAILTDPGGSVLPGRSASDVGFLHRVAILTDPGGSVLRGCLATGRTSCRTLRSSPTPEGRCCTGRRWSPNCAPPGSCDPHRPRRVGAAHRHQP